MTDKLSYADTGVDIDATDEVKRRMAGAINSGDKRVLNQLGAFAPLVQGTFPDMEDPLLVIKTDEPGSKQKLAIELDTIEDLSHDLINHTVNDVVMMGAHPMYVTDCIVCGTLDKKIVPRLVDGMAAACQKQSCVLIGGETSVQPGVVTDGLFVLSATVVGVVDRPKVIDGSRISAGDVVLAVASNGLHTNGYSLVRALLAQKPELAGMKVGDETFLDAIMRPHLCYFQPFRDLFELDQLHGMAHITGGGIQGNLDRILPDHLDGIVNLSALQVLPVFRLIRDQGKIDDADMLRTFNVGVGMTLVVAAAAVDPIRAHLRDQDCDSYVIGEIVPGEKQVKYAGELNW